MDFSFIAPPIGSAAAMIPCEEAIKAYGAIVAEASTGASLISTEVTISSLPLGLVRADIAIWMPVGRWSFYATLVAGDICSTPYPRRVIMKGGFYESDEAEVDTAIVATASTKELDG